MSIMKERARSTLRQIAQDIHYIIYRDSSDLANSTDECCSGDSYSQTGLDLGSTHPSPSDLIGNPIFPGYTTYNGKNWVSDTIWDDLEQ